MTRNSLFPLLLAAALPPWALAQESLGEGVPADAFLYAHWQSRPRTGFADRYLGRFREALGASGIVDDFVRALTARVEEDDRGRFELEARHWQKVLSGVEWWRLLSREVSFAARRNEDGRTEIIVLFRVGTKARNAALVAIRQILYGFCALADDYELLVSDRKGVPTTVLYSGRDPGDQISIGGYGTAVVVSTSVRLLRQSLELLEGKGSSLSLIHDEPYRRALAEFEAEPADGDSPARSRFEFLLHPREVFKEVSTLDVVDIFHVLARFRGDRVEWDLRYRLKDREDNPLARSFAPQRTVEDLLRRVPASAAAFELRSGAEPETYYEHLLHLIDVFSGGPLLSDFLRRSQSEREFDLKEDLLRFLTGRRAYLLFRPATGSEAKPEPEEPAGWSRAFLFELEKERQSREGMRERLKGVAAFLEGLGLKVERSGAETETDPSYVVSTAVFLGWHLYFGISSSDLVVATSRTAYQRAWGASNGRKTILEDPRFQRLWRDPQGGLDGVTYGSFAGDLEALRSTIRLVGGLARFLPDGGDAGFIKPALIVLPRLERAVESLDFLSHEIGYTVRQDATYRGRGTIFLHRVRDL